MSERFFIEHFIMGERAVLTGSEVHHLAGVKRAKVGDEVTLFDGSGREFVGRIDLLKKDRCELTVMYRQEVSRESEIAITAGVALPKGDRQKWLVEKLTEIGVGQLVPLMAARGVAQPGEQVASRLRRTVIEACKQCGRNQLLQIMPPVAAKDWFGQFPRGGLRLLADPTGQPIDSLRSVMNNQVCFAIGPEGGFTPEETAAASSAGWQPVSLGKSILRIETAAIALAAACIALASNDV